MKIAIDASRYGVNEGTGVEKYCREIIDALLEEKKQQNIEFILYAKPDSVLAKRKEARIIARKRLWSLIGLSQVLKKEKPDALFVPGHILPFYAPENSIVTIHDVAFKVLPRIYGIFQYLYLDWSTRRAVKKAKKIIVPSKSTANDIQIFYQCPPEKIFIVPHGYKKETKNEGKMKWNPYLQECCARPFFLFVGRLELKKNLLNLIESFALFLAKNQDFCLVLAGKRGQGFEKIWRKIEMLNLQEKIFLPGYLDEKEKAFLLAKARALVFISAYEGFGFPILEAFSYELPVLSARNSSLREVGGEAVLYCEGDDTRDISEKLVKIAYDSDWRKKAKIMGLERLKKFDWRKSAQKTLAIILKS